MPEAFLFLFLPDTHSDRHGLTRKALLLLLWCRGVFFHFLFSEGKWGSLQLPLECTYGHSGGEMGVGRGDIEHMVPSVTLLDRDSGRKWETLCLHNFSIYDMRTISTKMTWLENNLQCDKHHISLL